MTTVFQPLLSLTTAVVVAALLLSGHLPADACSMPQGWRPPTLVERILRAHQVLLGRVRATQPDPRSDYGSGTSAYSADVDVYCIIKGRRADPVVRIHEAGHIPGLCHSSNLTVGHEYIILARYDDDGKYRITSMQIDATGEKLREVAMACGLQQLYPNGVNPATVAIRCPEPAPPGECKTSEDFIVPSSSTVRPADEPSDYDYYIDAKYNENVEHAAASLDRQGGGVPAYTASSLLTLAVVLITCALTILWQY